MASSSANGKLKYSAMEQSLLALLQHVPNTRLDTNDLASSHYGRRRPRNARQSVIVTMRSLTDKVKRNKEPFIVKRSKRTGPHPIQFWIEKRVS